MNSVISTTAAISLGLLVSTVAIGADPGWYVGVKGGQSQADIDQDELDDVVLFAFSSVGAPVITGSSTLDDSDTAWSVLAGYQVSNYFAVEAAYQDLGSFPYRSSGTVNPPGPIVSAPASLNIDFETAGFTLAALGIAPIGEVFDLHGRLGVFFADTEMTVTGSSTGVSVSEDVSASSQSLFYGVGAALTFAEKWTFSLDWQQFKDVGDEEEIGEADVDLISLSVIYRL